MTDELALLRAALEDPVAAFAYADWLDEQGKPDDAARVRSKVGFVRKVEITEAWDRRHPDPSKNYGVHGCDLRMVLCGPKGAVQFLAFTHWQLPHVREEWLSGALNADRARALFCPSGADVGHHSPKPLHDGQRPMDGTCEYIGGRPCYYDGSGLAGDAMMDVLIVRGDEAVWASLRERYDELFT